MHKLLIIYPHWYPSNLAGVHRSRLVGNYLHDFGWQPIILTVNSKFYEETPDPDIHRLFSPHFKEYRVNAFRIIKPRIVGDIGLRAFWQLYRKGKQIIKQEKPDFLWIPIPSFYTALLGRLLHHKTKITYGIDYIDPWVRDISKDGSLKAQISLWIAKLLEPIAVKKASLITGVAFEYYKPVLDRNFRIKGLGLEPNKSYNIHHCAFPYGFDPHDHVIDLPGLKLPWDDRLGCKPIVYAGAFMPNSQYFLKQLFETLAILEKEEGIDPAFHFYFLGTGYYPHKSITDYATDFGLQKRVTEVRDRYSYLHILNFLKKAEKVMIIGSTEKHYTASKTFQVILSGRPVFSMFHYQSSACDILVQCVASKYLYKYDPTLDINTVDLAQTLKTFLNDNQWNPNYKPLSDYSSKNGAKLLTSTIDYLISER